MAIRNSAKAIIIKNGKLLTIKGKDHLGIFYILPGGGQNKGETVTQALIRECQEEINAKVIVYDLRYIREYIGKNHEFSEFDSDIHQVEYIFICEIEGESEVKMGDSPDEFQVGIEWIPLEEIGKYRIYPKILKDLITPKGDLLGPIYLGDVN